MAAPVSPRTEERVNILAVDDSPDKLLSLSAILSELHQNVMCAASGREALWHLLRAEFAVVLLDVNMPGLDGFETAALMRQRKSCEHTPIIFITSYGDESHAVRGYKLGAVDYILAPVDPEVLKTKIMVFVELFRKASEVRRQAHVLEQRAEQFQRLARASMAINSAVSIDGILAVVASLGRGILGANQAVAVAAADQKWSSPRVAVSLSPEYEKTGERPVLRDREALLSVLSKLRETERLPRGLPEEERPWREALAGGAAGDGWLAAPLCGRDGRTFGLIHLLDRAEGDFGEEDEAILTQLAQMSSIAIENTVNAEALESNRLKDEFLTTLSHELRTPLSAILGWTRTLRSGPLEDRASHGLAVIERNVLAQTKLIDDLLDVSRIITGKLFLTLRRTYLGGVIEAACESMRPAAEARGIELVFERRVPPEEDAIVGDADRLLQIVWNLVSNGIKFTPARGRVTVRLERFESHFEIRVIDTGRGIRPEFLSHVFERFRQADSSTSRAQGGLGIGLAIVRHLTELHGGSISVESAGEDRGATFTVQLPAVALGLETTTEARRRSQLELPKRIPTGAPDLTGVSVLVVEDDPDTRELAEHTLRLAGADVLAVDSALEAVEMLRSHPPDVLVSDIGLPYQDGYSLIDAVRKLPAGRGRDVPALAVTAYAREEDRMKALIAGFQGHLAKPFEPEALVSSVGSLVGRVPLAPPSADRPASADSPESATAGTGQEPGVPARILIVEDDRDSREGLRELLQVWGHFVEVAQDGTEAIEKALETRPGVALIDIGLPGLDGYEVAHRIREAFGQQPIVLVALTGYVDSEAGRRAAESGFDAHLPKPVNVERLRPILEKACPAPTP